MWYLIMHKKNREFELVQDSNTHRYTYMWFNIERIHRCLENKRYESCSINSWITIQRADIIATFTKTPTVSSIKQWFDDHPELFI